MATYKKILIALDFQSDNSEILAKGREIAGDNAEIGRASCRERV